MSGPSTRVRRLARGLLLVLGLLGLYLGFWLTVVYAGALTLGPDTNRGRNGLWLGHRWLNATAPDLQILEQRCRHLGLRYLFVHAGPLDAQGHIPALDLAGWRRTRAALHQACPDTLCLAWLGSLNAEFWGKAADTLDLADPQGVLATARQLVDSGFDGIHYDIEPLRCGDPHFVELLAATREALGGKLLSVATPQLQPPGLPGLPPLDRLWSLDYYRQVAAHCDQLVLMGYDTLQPTSELYSRYLRYQTRQLCREWSDRLLVGVPTYTDNPPFHNPHSETLEAGLRGVLAGGDPEGVAVYAEWTTTAEDWETLARVWGAYGGR